MSLPTTFASSGLLERGRELAGTGWQHFGSYSSKDSKSQRIQGMNRGFTYSPWLNAITPRSLTRSGSPSHIE